MKLMKFTSKERKTNVYKNQRNHGKMTNLRNGKCSDSDFMLSVIEVENISSTNQNVF